MPNKMQLVELNTIQGGNKMKCTFCDKEFTPVVEEDVCEDCMHAVDELTNNKGDDADE